MITDIIARFTNVLLSKEKRDVVQEMSSWRRDASKHHTKEFSDDLHKVFERGNITGVNKRSFPFRVPDRRASDEAY